MAKEVEDSFSMFVQVGETLFKCQKCGGLINSGIINISDHWVGCDGINPTLNPKTEDDSFQETGEIEWKTQRNHKTASKTK